MQVIFDFINANLGVCIVVLLFLIMCSVDLILLLKLPKKKDFITFCRNAAIEVLKDILCIKKGVNYEKINEQKDGQEDISKNC